MIGSHVYTIPQAAGILDMPEEELVLLIESKRLAADFHQGLMSYVISQEQLLEFMKTKKMFSKMQKILMNRVLICDRDSDTIFLVRTELERSGKITVRVATSSRDAEKAIQEFLPDVVAVPLVALQRATDNLAGALRPARADRPLRVIIYVNLPEAVIETREDIKKLKASLRVEDVVSTASGTRKLVTKLEEIFGIKRESRKLPTFTGFGPAPQTPPSDPASPDKKRTTSRRKASGDTTRRRRGPNDLPPIPPVP